MLPLGQLLTKGATLLSENSTTILTAFGVSGVVTTAALTHRATKEATLRIAYETAYRENNPQRPEHSQPLTKAEMFQMTWPLYIPPVIMGTFTIAAIIASNQIYSQRVAALVMTQTLTEKQLEEYKDKVVEKLGFEKAKEVKQEIIQDKIDQDPPTRGNVIVTGSGDVLCLDVYTGRYFTSSPSKIDLAAAATMAELARHNEVSLAYFYDELGIPLTPNSNDVGWNINVRFELDIEAKVAEDKRPCLAIDFLYAPIHEYERLY